MIDLLYRYQHEVRLMMNGFDDLIPQSFQTLTPTKIIIVEDDQALSDLMTQALKQEGYSVESILRGEEAIPRIIEDQPHLVLLDLMLPDLNGIEVCRAVRDQFNGYIIMLTAKGDETSQLLGFEVGADDYVIKPVQPSILKARIKAHLRHLTPVTNLSSPLKIEVTSRNVSVYGRDLKLTTSEFDLLSFLFVHQGQTLTRQILYRELRGIDYDGLDRSIDLRVSKIRSHLRSMGLNQEVIKTVHGRGYHFIPLNQISDEHEG
jgi:DNA-binding response OmpR family regulator